MSIRRKLIFQFSLTENSPMKKGTVIVRKKSETIKMENKRALRMECETSIQRYGPIFVQQDDYFD